jgi:hypothetical protein
MSIAVILSFAVFAFPSWAASKEKIDKEKADIRKVVESRGEAASGYPINDIRFILNYDFKLL